ncbi:MAG: hypothetical protein BJ554DRAFT_82 [Olpidium bornovanus]|uniref:Uncharacterized protein n=1 Tax=Olpidium bornovanus TaxID=278681 RepID=A0A8H7ZUD6_9FUNG|nr:MAG: hypothetical protein BJ554DRAFT_82 [Olpidium bornovanus]
MSGERRPPAVPAAERPKRMNLLQGEQGGGPLAVKGTTARGILPLLAISPDPPNWKRTQLGPNWEDQERLPQIQRMFPAIYQVTFGPIPPSTPSLSCCQFAKRFAGRRGELVTKNEHASQRYLRIHPPLRLDLTFFFVCSLCRTRRYPRGQPMLYTSNALYR